MSDISGEVCGRSRRDSGSGIVGFGSSRTSVPVGDNGGSRDDQNEPCESRVICRLKLRKLPDNVKGGDVGLEIVRLFGLSLGDGDVGLVAIVQKLLFLELPLEDAEELLVLELIFRSRLKAPALLIGGLEAIDGGGSDN